MGRVLALAAALPQGIEGIRPFAAPPAIIEDMQTYVVKYWPDGTPVGPQQTASGAEPYTPPTCTPEGIVALAAALGMQREEIGAPVVSEGLRAALAGAR